MKIEKAIYHSADGIKIVSIINKPEQTPISCIILCHGITTDKEESGKFTVVAEKLCKKGFEVLRFDFRGHGKSGSNSEDMTLKGELLDLEASVSYIGKRFDEIGILAASFGAASAIHLALKNKNFIKTIVLWNPVLDYEQTFLKSRLPWGKSIFSLDGYQSLKEKGYVTIPGKDFRIGSELVKEFTHQKPYEEIKKLKCPVLTFHGSKDTKVPFWISRKFGKPNDLSQFIAVESDHGFGDCFDYVCEKTLDWFNICFRETGH